MINAASNTFCVVSDLINSSGGETKLNDRFENKERQEKQKNIIIFVKQRCAKKNAENVSSYFTSQICLISSVPLDALDLVSLDDHRAPSVSSYFNIMEIHFDNIIASAQTY